MPAGPYAHSGSDYDQSDWQTLNDHLVATAFLAAERGAQIGLEYASRLAGAWHDFGKHDPAFQSRLMGAAERVDHSTAGAALLLKRASGQDERLVAELVAYAILGHHAGLPDATGSDASMAQRLDKFQDKVPQAVTAAAQIETVQNFVPWRISLRHWEAVFEHDGELAFDGVPFAH